MTKEKQLYRPLFIISIVLLLINDLYLKYEYSGYLTGKLSDFAGLFAFPFFFSCVFPKQSKVIYGLSACLFLFWNSALSQPMFDMAHDLGIGINRTIDVSDFMALFVLPASYSYWHRTPQFSLAPRRLITPVIIGISCLSFIATTLPKHYEKIGLKSGLKLEKQWRFEKAQKAMYFYASSQKERFIYHIVIPEKNMSIKTKIAITDIPSGGLEITLDSILGYTINFKSIIFRKRSDKEAIAYAKNLTKEAIEHLFRAQLENQN